MRINRCGRFSFAALFAFAASALAACVARTYNSQSETNTLFQAAHPRIAIDYLGLGWCYYLEDKSAAPLVFKTNQTEDQVRVDLSTGVETRQRFEVLYIIRQFNKAHELSMEFQAVDEWRNNNLNTIFRGQPEWNAVGLIDSEMQNVRNHLNMRVVDLSFCKTLHNDAKQQETPTLNKDLFKGRPFSEYNVRCQGEAGEVMSRSSLEQLSEAEYKIANKILTEITTLPAYVPFRRSGAKCRASLRQMEISRGRLLQATQQKVF